MDNSKKETSKNVLIVEDDMLLSLVEERLIEKLGHTVIGKAGSAEEAIRKQKELEPDLILMDIVLKGELDGIEAMQEIRKTSDVPVIYLSGNSDRYNYERAKKTEFTDYLVKPISSRDLTEPLNKAFNPESDQADEVDSSQERNIKNLSSQNGQIINKSA